MAEAGAAKLEQTIWFVEGLANLIDACAVGGHGVLRRKNGGHCQSSQFVDCPCSKEL